ncbi:hypothetical protein [Microbacterium sp.]|uniref:hypothetical protein n=1 Tax=Microbacterium sp. TaxID=51671 RepID=UPI003C78B8BB
MSDRVLGFIVGVLLAPSLIANRLVRTVLFPASRPSEVQHRGLERLGRIANVLGVVLVVWAAVATDISGRGAFGEELRDAFVNAVVVLVVIGALILCAAVLFVCLARRGNRLFTLRRVLIPIAAWCGYLVIVVGSILLANVLVPFGEWVQARLRDGILWFLLLLLMIAAMLFLLTLFVTALLMGSWHGSTQLFRSADAHPLFPIVVGFGMAAASLALALSDALSPDRQPVTVLDAVVLFFGPVVAVTLLVIEGAWLMCPPRSIRFRETYVSTARGDGR